MDGETIRLIVVALGAIAAALSAQIIAGAYNSRNTIATIEAARLAAEAQREADRDVEHGRWLRDRKLVAYTTLMSQMQEIDLLIQDTHKFPETADTSRITELASKLASDELMLLVPKKVKSAITSLFPSVRAMIAATADFPEGDERVAAYEKAADEFAARYVKLTALIREDLGAED